MDKVLVYDNGLGSVAVFHFAPLSKLITSFRVTVRGPGGEAVVEAPAPPGLIEKHLAVHEAGALQLAKVAFAEYLAAVDEFKTSKAWDEPEDAREKELARLEAVAAFTAEPMSVKAVLETEEEQIRRVAAKAIPPGIAFTAVPKSQIPTDRTYRDAWTHDGTRFDYDFARARELHRDRLRAQRAPLLEQLDIEYQRADEAGDLGKKAKIAIQKQALRDVTKHPAIDSASTIEQLKAAVPEILRA